MNKLYNAVTILSVVAFMVCAIALGTLGDKLARLEAEHKELIKEHIQIYNDLSSYLGELVSARIAQSAINRLQNDVRVLEMTWRWHNEIEHGTNRHIIITNVMNGENITFRINRHYSNEIHFDAITNYGFTPYHTIPPR